MRQAHEQGVKVKIYYTVRELSNYCAELFPLRSLGTEVFTDGPGGGHSWLCEHLVSGYAPAWHQPYPDGSVDAAIATTGLSRWHNYYLEGLAWLLRHAQIDGLYLDGIGYDREIMKRVRKVMERERPGCLIDFHSGNNFHPQYGLSNCANQYLEHFPYVDSLWFGEGFDYNESPDYWLVEISGLPFGLFGEMLQDNGNPWRGMVYGMTARYYAGADPKHLWRLWDEFGIQDAEMRGYWDPQCPVRTGRDDVLATVYQRRGRTLVALAGWAPQPARVRLDVDWRALGLDPQRATCYAPGVQGFQPEALFAPADEIPVEPGRGWLLVLSEEQHELAAAADPHAGLRLLLEERFAAETLGPEWTTHLSPQPGTRLTSGHEGLRVDARANVSAFAQRPLPPGTSLVECHIYSGTDQGASWGPGLRVMWPQGHLRINLRAEGRYGADDRTAQVFGGKVEPRRWHQVRVRLTPGQVLAEASSDGRTWETIHTLPRTRLPGDPVAVRIGKETPDGSGGDYETLGPPGTCRITDLRAYGP